VRIRRVQNLVKPNVRSELNRSGAGDPRTAL
jgi:hypothetical protein